MEQAARPAVRGSNRCPIYPRSGACAPALTIPSCVPSALQFFAALVSHPTGHEQTEALGRISFARNQQKRGPPAFLLS
jgi:hypothetical protein